MYLLCKYVKESLKPYPISFKRDLIVQDDKPTMFEKGLRTFIKHYLKQDKEVHLNQAMKCFKRAIK